MLLASWPLGCRGDLSLKQSHVGLGVSEGKPSWVTVLTQAGLSAPPDEGTIAFLL